MSALSAARTAVHDLLDTLGTGRRTERRTCFSTDGSDEPTGIAPVCPDEDHEADDGSVFDCCPEPVIECNSHTMAAYLAELLNADRRGAS